MNRAIDLAREALGRTSPNPPVGAVLVSGGEVVGEGSTQPPGGPHAERVALARAGERARGATLYVTLEPCSHWGRTPPCADAIIAAGVSEVHVAADDPNPRVNGEGLRLLRAAGINVVAEPRREAHELIEGHAMMSTAGRPFVTAAYAPTSALLDALRPSADVILQPGGKTEPPERMLEWTAWLRERAAHGVASVLVVVSESDTDLRDSLEKAGLPDKAVAPTAVLLPLDMGAAAEERRDPVPHVVAYRAAR
jgi:diaminohydroxyphosphoribosylaminopyrimidine deaminase/5-amino-6-(5-phosphoribosylamino)uracil reductase